jgi:hypothetical protein
MNKDDVRIQIADSLSTRSARVLPHEIEISYLRANPDYLSKNPSALPESTAVYLIEVTYPYAYPREQYRSGRAAALFGLEADGTAVCWSS